MDFSTLQKQIDDGLRSINSTFETFKKENDKQIEALKKGVQPTGEQKEFIERLHKGMDELTVRVQNAEKALNRPEVGHEDTSEAGRKAAAKALKEYMARGSDSVEQRRAIIAAYEAKGLSVGSDPDGGYWVTPHVSAEVNKKIIETSPMRELATVISISTDRFEEKANWDEADSGWVGETGSRPVTGTPQFNKLEIPVRELYAKPEATQNLLDDASFDVEAWLAGEVSDKFARDEATAFISGSGVTRPRGFTTYTSGTTYGTVEQVTTGVSADITADSLIDLQMALIEAFQPQAQWLMHRTTMKVVRKLKAGDGHYLMSIEKGLQGGLEFMLLGKPVRFGSDMAEVGASTLSVAYADFKRFYLIVDRIGLRTLRDPYSNKPNVQFYTTKRVGGGVRNFQAGKLLKCST